MASTVCSRRSAAVVLVLLLLVPAGARADLRSLVAQIRVAKAKMQRTPQAKRPEFVKDHVLSLLLELGELDDEPSLRFLEKEYGTARGAMATACAAALLKNSSGRALQVVISGYSRQVSEVRKLILENLAAAERSLVSAQKQVIDLLRLEKDAGVRELLPAVVGKVDTVVAARALMLSVRPVGGRRGRAAAETLEFNFAVVEALGKTKSDEVRDWLADDAFEKAPEERLIVLARLAGSLVLKAARERLVEALGHRSEEVLAASVEALAKVGVGDAVTKITKLLRGGKRRGVELTIQVLDALAASGDASAIDVVLELARAGDVETRTIAMGSLALQHDSAAAFGGILAGLDDPDEGVRNMALRVLGRFRVKEMIAPLIHRIETEKDAKLRLDALRLLVRITDKNMGLQTDDWRKWWEVAETAFKFPTEEKAFTTVKAYDLEYFGLELSSKRITFVVDMSGSMRRTVKIRRRIEEADDDGKTGKKGRARGKQGGGGIKPGEARKVDVLKAELVRVIGKLPVDTSINIIFFHAVYSSWKKKLHPLAGAGRRQAIKFVHGLSNGSGTNVFDTLEFALRDRRVDTILLLTDGKPTRGKYQDSESIRREVSKLNRVRGATINCIAFGEESEMLEALARENDGEYRFVDEY